MHACNSSEHIVGNLVKTVVLLLTGQNIAPEFSESNSGLIKHKTEENQTELFPTVK